MSPPHHRRCHIVADRVGAEVLGAELGSLETVVDLTLDQSLESMPEEALPPAVRVISTSVATRKSHDRARDVYLEWIAEFGERDIVDGEGLRELFRYGDDFSLWWTLPLHVKSYNLHPLPKLVQRALWLESDADDVKLARQACTTADELAIWGDTPSACRFLHEAIQKCTDRDADSEVAYRRPDGGTHSTPTGEPDAVDLWNHVVETPRWRFVQRFGYLDWTIDSGIPDELPCTDGPVDVAVVTFPEDWDIKRRNGRIVDVENRYLKGVIERLRRRGRSVAWVPALRWYTDFEEFVPVLARQSVPVARGALERPVETFDTVCDKLRDAYLRFADLRETLVGHPALQFRGLDVSGWVVDALDEHVRFRAPASAQMYELVDRALDELQPETVLYRNEFYETGRLVSAAVPEGTRRLAFQHGTIPRQHWVYQFDRRELGELHGRERDPLERLPCPDLFLAYSDHTRDLMAETGYPADCIESIGSLRHDAMFEKAAALDPESDKSAARRQLGWPADAFLPLICGQMPHLLPRWIALLTEGLDRLGADSHVIMKPHWQYRDIPLIEQSFDECGWHRYSLYDGELDPAIVASDVVLTGTSTTGLEAAILETPLICYGRDNVMGGIPYVESGFALPATDVDSMERALRAVRDPEFRADWPERRARFLSHFTANFEAPAVDTLTEIITDAFDPDDTSVD